MEVWERGRVQALAPDDAARRAAVPLLSAGRWSDDGCAAGGADGSVVLWGRCHGSAEYDVSVRVGESYRCSCPSRKLPCKHALALMLRWSAGEVVSGDAPAHAQRLLEPTRPAAAAEPSAPRDTEAAAQRAAARVRRVASGLDELDRWLGDQVRTGLAGLERSGHDELEAVAARMVDAQAPGVAGMLRAVPALLAGEGWPSRVLDAFAALHLLVAAHRGLDALAPELAATVRARVGYPVSKASVLAGPAAVDHWRAVASVDVVEGRLEARRVWLWGASTRRWALLLSFAVPGAGLDDSVLPGQVLHAALHFYPGAGESRAVVGEQWPLPDDGVPPPPASWSETVRQAHARWAELVANDPWAARMPAALEAVPVPPWTGDASARADRGDWHLRDADGTAVRLVETAVDPWPLLALSGGEPVTVVGEWGSGGFRPLRALVASASTTQTRLVAVA